jgi:hypothetical protein
MDPRTLMVGAAGTLLAAIAVWRAMRSGRADLDVRPVSDDWLAENRRARDPNAYL